MAHSPAHSLASSASAQPAPAACGPVAPSPVLPIPPSSVTPAPAPAFAAPDPVAAIAYASCLPHGVEPALEAEALTSRAAYERLNRAAARAETLVLYRLDMLAACRDSLDVDQTRLEASVQNLWRLTAVRKSLQGMEHALTLQERAGAAPPEAPEEQKKPSVIDLPPHIYDHVQAAILRERNGAPPPENPTLTLVRKPDRDAVPPAPSPDPAPAAPAGFAAAAEFSIGSAAVASIQSPSPSQSQSIPSTASIGSTPSTGSIPSIESIGSIGSIPTVAQSPSLQVSPSSSVAQSPSPQVSRSSSSLSIRSVPACPRLSPSSAARTLDRVNADLANYPVHVSTPEDYKSGVTAEEFLRPSKSYPVTEETELLADPDFSPSLRTQISTRNSSPYPQVPKSPCPPVSPSPGPPVSPSPGRPVSPSPGRPVSPSSHPPG